MYRVGNGGRYGCETVAREVLPQVEISEKLTQGPPRFAITTAINKISTLFGGTNSRIIFCGPFY